MSDDPKAAEARKKMEELLKKMSAEKIDTSKLAAVINEGNTLKSDKELD